MEKKYITQHFNNKKFFFIVKRYAWVSLFCLYSLRNPYNVQMCGGIDKTPKKSVFHIDYRPNLWGVMYITSLLNIFDDSYRPNFPDYRIKYEYIKCDELTNNCLQKPVWRRGANIENSIITMLYVGLNFTAFIFIRWTLFTAFGKR